MSVGALGRRPLGRQRLQQLPRLIEDAVLECRVLHLRGASHWLTALVEVHAGLPRFVDHGVRDHLRGALGGAPVLDQRSQRRDRVLRRRRTTTLASRPRFVAGLTPGSTALTCSRGVCARAPVPWPGCTAWRSRTARSGQSCRRSARRGRTRSARRTAPERSAGGVSARPPGPLRRGGARAGTTKPGRGGSQ